VVNLDLSRDGDVLGYIKEKNYTIGDAAEVIGSLVNYLRTGSAPVRDKIKVQVKEGDKVVVKEYDTFDLKTKTLGDAISTKEVRDLMPIAVQYIVRDEIEAHTPFTSLFTQIPYNGTEYNLVLSDIPPIEIYEVMGGSYRNININFGSTSSERINLDVKTYGGMISVDKDFMSTPYSSTYLGMIFNKVGNAFARKKEAVVQSVITNSNAVTLYDNVTPSSARLGATSGRGIDGNFNNTFSPYDFMNAYTYGYTNFGVYYNTIIMHPFAWSMFMMTPEMKSMMVGDNGKIGFPQMPQGNVAGGFATGRPFEQLFPQENIYGLPNVNSPEFKLDPTALSKLGTNPYDTYPSFMWSSWKTNPGANSFINQPMNIILTPVVPFAKSGSTYVTDIILADSNNVGAIFQAQNPQVREKGRTDEFEDVILYKFDEKYGVLPYLRGEGFGLIKNVNLQRQFVFDNVNSASLAPSGDRGEFKL